MGKKTDSQESLSHLKHPLPCKEDVLQNTSNKSLLNTILCGYSLSHNIQLANAMDSAITHAEVDFTLCSCMLKAETDCGVQTIRTLSDEIDVFVLLEYLTSRNRVTSKFQMKKWDCSALDINETIVELGSRKCSPVSRCPSHVGLRYGVVPFRQ